MYEIKGVCPFIGSCEYHKKILQLERGLNGNRRRAVLRLKDGNIYDDKDFTDIQKHYDTFNRLRARCFENHGRCLMYWRLRKQKIEAPSIMQEPEILRPTTN